MAYRMTYANYIDTAFYNGPLAPYLMHNLGLGKVGCKWRGTTLCHRCQFQPVQECDYNCSRCAVRGMCKCGHDQTARLRAWGLVE